MKGKVSFRENLCCEGGRSASTSDRECSPREEKMGKRRGKKVKTGDSAEEAS